MERVKKVWGHTTELFRNNTTSVHYIEIDKGGYCSEHRHKQKSNIFFMIEGNLQIDFWDINSVEYSIYLPSDIGYKNHVILPNTWHTFKAVTDVKCMEIYEYLYDGVDIERRREGGMDEN